MDWQSIVAVGIAGVCGIWVLWRWLRPLRRKGGHGCHLCDECAGRQRTFELLHIQSPDSTGPG